MKIKIKIYQKIRKTFQEIFFMKNRKNGNFEKWQFKRTILYKYI